MKDVMLDHEVDLLIFAGRSIGIVGNVHQESGRVHGISLPNITPDSEPRFWNPLLDDGDAARLNSVLAQSTIWFNTYVLVGRDDEDSCCEFFFNHGGNKDKAFRVASTKAAAAVERHRGKQDA